MAHEEPLRNLQEARAQKHAGGRDARDEKQHPKGELTARERLEHLLDPATLIEDQSYVTGTPRAADPARALPRSV